MRYSGVHFYLSRLSSFSKMETSRLCHALVYFMFSFVAWQLDFAQAADGTDTTTKPTSNKLNSTTTAAAAPNGGHGSNNVTEASGGNPFGDMFYDKGMLRRSFYVLIGATGIVLVFFAYRWFRSKGRRKTKKYGVLATRSSEMELRPLDQDDDEEDMTVFDVNSK